MEKTISRDGTPIAFWRSGTGPPLLLVHGATADHSRWAAISPRFEERFTAYAMDWRGRGGSGDGPVHSIWRESEDVAAVVEVIGEPAFVVGHSYGATCSLEAALLTDRIRKLVLYEAPVPIGLSMYRPNVPDRMEALIEEGEREAALEVFMREVVRMPEDELAAYRQLPPWQVRIQIASTIARELMFDRTYRFDAGRFAALHVPALLLLGGDSPTRVRRETEAVDAALPNSRVVVLPGQQHIAMDTAPELFVREVQGFLLEQDS